MGILLISFVVYQFVMTNGHGETIFRIEKGKYLPGNVIKTLQVTSQSDCSMFCSWEVTCASVNYKISGENKGKCELITASLSNRNNVEKPGYNNLEIVHRNCNKSYQYFSRETKTCVGINSCKEHLAHNPSTPNGNHFLQTNASAQPYPVYCHMDEILGCGGGGWTLVMKLDGSQDTFAFNSAYWNDTRSYNVHGGLEGILTDNETKLESFWKTPFSKICLGMKTGDQQTRWITVDQEANSLHSLFADATFRPTNLGRVTWKSLIDTSSLQYNCRREGFNVKPTSTDKLRLGIMTNDENDCNSCDSFIGFGGHFLGCGVLSPITTGNYASCNSNDNGHKTTSVIGYILVQ